VPPIPDGKGLAGPVTASRWRRSIAAYLLLLALGTAMAWSGDLRTASFGLGLVMPGGGFLLHAGLESASALLQSAVRQHAAAVPIRAVPVGGDGHLLPPILMWRGRRCSPRRWITDLRPVQRWPRCAARALSTGG